MKLLTLEEAADRIGCSRTHIYDLIAAGKLRRFHISAKTGARKPKTRVADVDVDAFIQAAEAPIPAAS